MKHIRLLIAAALSAVSMLGFGEFDTVDGVEYTYVVESDDTVTITCVMVGDVTDVVIPDTLGGYPVTTLGESAFDIDYRDTENITSVVIPEGVTHIGQWAFWYCTALESVTMPSSVTHIGAYAFYGCSGLTSLTMPEGVASIGDKAFYGCSGLADADGFVIVQGTLHDYCGSATSVTIPEGVTTIGADAFSDCDALASVTIPEGVTTIGADAFSDCDALASVTIPSSVETIGDSAFIGCGALASVYFEGDAPAMVGSGAFFGVASGAKAYVKPGAAGFGADGAGWNGLVVEKDVLFEMDNGVLYVYSVSSGKAKVDRVSVGGVTEITIPLTLGGYSVTALGESAFDTDYRDTENVTSVTIPSGVTEIGMYAFYGCWSLTSVTIPSSVVNIGNGAFYGCDGLADADGFVAVRGGLHYYCGTATSVTIPADVSSIGLGAFMYRSDLTSVTIPPSVTSIGENAFEYCDGLTSVTIPPSVTSIGGGAFADCVSLESVYFEGDAPTVVGTYAFDGVASGAKAYVQPGATGFGADGADWNGLEVEKDAPFEVENGVVYRYSVSSGKATVNRVSVGGATEITIPLELGGYSVTALGESAFDTDYCDTANVTSVTIPSGVTELGMYAFYGCWSLTSVTIPSSVTSIGMGAFYGCDGLADADGFVAVRGGLHYYCGTATSVTIPADVTSIGWCAFEYCSDLTSVVIPPSVTSIGDDAFYECGSLESVYFGGDAPASVGTSAFYGVASGAKACVKPDATGFGDDGAVWNGLVVEKDVLFDVSGGVVYFYSVTDGKATIDRVSVGGVTDVVIPETLGGYPVTALGESAFDNDYNDTENVASVVIPDGVTSIRTWAFYDCTALESVTIPSSVTEIGTWAFVNCSGLTSVTIPEGVTSIGDGAFYGCSGLADADGFVVVREVLHYYCGTATSVTIPEGVTTIGKEAFYDCDALESVTIPEGVATIGDYAFYDCDALALVTISEGVETIGEEAFYDCDALESVAIPSSVATIEDCAFEDCVALASVCFEGDAPAVGVGAFDGVAADAQAYVRRASTGWGVEIPGTWNGLAIDYYPVFAVTFGANGGSAVPAQTVEKGLKASSPANPTKDGYVFAGWFSDAGLTTAYDFASPVTADLTLYAKWVAEEPITPPPVEPEPSPELYEHPAATPFEGNATYNGWVRDESGAIAGTLVIKAGKPAKPEKGGQSKLSISYTPFGGKKRTIKLDSAAMPIAGGNPVVTIPGIGAVTFGGTSLAGAGVQAGADLSKSKDKAAKAAANARLAQMNGVWTFALATDSGAAAFSLTVKKGKGKFVGTLPDGTKVSVSSTGILGDGVLALPFAHAKKGACGFVFWIGDDGATVEVSDIAPLKLSNGTTLAATLVEPSAALKLADGERTFTVPDLGVVQTFMVAGKKWAFKKHVAKPTAEKPDLNPSDVKLKFTEKTGVVKGTFAVPDPSGKAVKYTVNGVVVGGKLHGAAFAKGGAPIACTAE